MVGYLNMGFKKIKNIADPEEPSEAANKKYVDLLISNTISDIITKKQLDEKIELIRNLLPFVKSGNIYEWFGQINMGQQRIYNLPFPVDDNEAATKDYVDRKFQKPATTIYAECKGGLVQGEKPFTFGCNTNNPIGYVIPSNGQILKSSIYVSDLTNTRFEIEILINDIGTGKNIYHISSEHSSTTWYHRSKYLILEEEDRINFLVKTNNPYVQFVNISLLIELDF